MMKPPVLNDDKGKIERLKDRLYSRTRPIEYEDVRTKIEEHPLDVSREWNDDEPIVQVKASKSRLSVFSKLFIASVVFFLVSLGVAAFYIFGSFNKLSPKNVDIAVLGPVSIAGGSELSLEVVVQNNNTMDLEDVAISVQYPDGTRSPKDLSAALNVERQAIGRIAAGKNARKTIKAVLFGEKDSVKDIKVTATYKIKTASTEFQKEKTYHIGIASSPLIMTVDYPKEVNAGDEFQFDIDLSSNTNTNLEGIVLRADLPFGFVFKGSDPAPFADNNVWKIGTLKPLEKRRVVVRGIIEAQDKEERTFRFYTGKASPDDDRMIGVGLTSHVESVLIKRPDVALDVKFAARASSEYISTMTAGQSTQMYVSVANNLPVTFENAQVTAKITGPILNRYDVTPGTGGYYKSTEDSIIWTRNTTPSLAQVEPGKVRRLAASISTMKPTVELVSAVQNPEITVDVVSTGERLVPGGLPQKITTSVTKKLKIETQVGLNSRIVYSVGPFKNTGPVPPKADKETTYTIIWSVTNSFNNASGAEVSATLPVYVKWLEAVSPTSERVTFDPLTRRVVWNIGELKRGVGYLASPREVAFQVSVLPSLSHVGSAPLVLSGSSLTARDNFTGTDLNAAVGGISTTMTTDPNYAFVSGQVEK